MPNGSYGGQGYFPTLFLKASAYMFHFSTGHAFVDANKRTGYMTMWTFLAVNGYNVVVETEVAYRFMKKKVCLGEFKEGKPPVMDSEELIYKIGEWIEHYAIPLSPDNIE